MSDRIFMTLVLPVGSENWRPEPFPGSEEAFARGCACPLLQPWPGRLTFAMDCPVHEMEHVKN